MSVVIPSLRAAVAVPGWAKNVLWRSARAVPSLDLRFADNKSLVDAVTGASLVTFTRASSGTFVDSAGVLQTAATDVPRFDHNPTTGESLGLLVEEARTNLLVRSEEFDNASWGLIGTPTANATTAPNGTITADLITTNGSQAQAFQGITISSGATVTGSYFLKSNGINEIEIVLLASNNTTPYGRATFNTSTGVVSVPATTSNGGTNASASIQAFANGWYRCSVTVTYPAVTSAGIRINAPGATGGIYLWGAQLEAGAFPTSYIPTTTAAATRSADVASIGGSAFTSFYNQTEGTVFAEFGPYGNGGATKNAGIVQIDSGSAVNRIGLFGGGIISPVFIVDTSSVNQVYISASTISPSAISKISGTYKVNDFARAVNGSNLGTDSSGSVPTVNQMLIGTGSAGVSELNGTIRRLVYWGQRLPNNVLQAITQ